MAVADTKSGECHFLYPAAPAAGFPPIKGIIRVFFPKCWSYSVEAVDEGGRPQQPKVLFLKIALFANASH